MAFDPQQPAYQNLRSIIAERTNPIIAWVGSGLSVPAGLPTWIRLRAILTETLKKKIDSFQDTDRAFLKSKLLAIENITDPWLVFQLLKEALGETSYVATVRLALTASITQPMPSAYSYLWRLKISGLFNLNLDRLATRALVETSGAHPLEFYGYQARSCAYVLKNPKPFIVNLHGDVEDTNSWVLTKEEIDWLLRQEGYKEFIKACLISRTVLFLGISADDIAVGGHVEALSKVIMDTGPHFWLTDRRDFATDAWAEKVGIRVVRYDASDNHSALDEFFQDILSFIPEEKMAPVVVPESPLKIGGTLQSSDDLERLDADSIRKQLNAKAQEILEVGTQEAYDTYKKFCKDYDVPIYRAWYTSIERGRNSLLGYILNEQVASGAFGTVYKAVDKSGGAVAIKVLKEEVRTKDQMLQGFRRGVQSMRILTRRSVQGMATYYEAAEIPAFVVMEWIEGPTLGEAVDSGFVTDWSTILRIAVDLARIIRSAHMLPERVLHRDIRPSNVMLKNYYINTEDWKVVVLDFDLSWHQGSFELSLIPGSRSALAGYLAPEQLKIIKDVSTRHASVDSFGLGMTLFFMAARRDPRPGENEYASWQSQVSSAVNLIHATTWKSLPNRFARLIINATYSEQSKRWDMSQISGELQRMYDVILNPDEVKSAELIAEELAARCSSGTSYIWEPDSASAVVQLASGIQINIKGSETAQELSLRISWTGSGLEERRRIFKWLPGVVSMIVSSLKSNQWSVRENRMDPLTLNVMGVKHSRDVMKNMDEEVRVLLSIVKAARFD